MISLALTARHAQHLEERAKACILRCLVDPSCRCHYSAKVSKYLAESKVEGGKDELGKVVIEDGGKDPSVKPKPKPKGKAKGKGNKDPKEAAGEASELSEPDSGCSRLSKQESDWNLSDDSDK